MKNGFKFNLSEDQIDELISNSKKRRIIKIALHQ